MSEPLFAIVTPGDIDPAVTVAIFANETYLRAVAKSDEQARAGNLPRLVARSGDLALLPSRTYAVNSRTGGAPHLVSTTPAVDGGCAVYECDCPAGRVPRLCWHVVHAHRAEQNHIGHFTLPELAR